MRFGVIGDFRKPGTRNHEAGGIDGAGFEGVDGGGVDGVGYTEVVGVDDEEFCAAWIAEFFLKSFGWYLCGGGVQKDAAGHDEEKRDVFHWEKTFRKS